MDLNNHATTRSSLRIRNFFFRVNGEKYLIRSILMPKEFMANPTALGYNLPILKLSLLTLSVFTPDNENFTPQYLARVFRLLLFKVIINTLNTQEENLTINFAQVNIFSGFASVVTFSWTLPRSPIFFWLWPWYTALFVLKLAS